MSPVVLKPGLLMNKNKTGGIWVGKLKHSKDKIEGIKQGSNKKLSHFADIRKQLIWGNKFIMFKNKSLMFDNWINIDLIYINDILNENGEIDSEFNFR